MTIRSALLLCDGLREVERINRSGSYTANLFFPSMSRIRIRIMVYPILMPYRMMRSIEYMTS